MLCANNSPNQPQRGTPGRAILLLAASLLLALWCVLPSNHAAAQSTADTPAAAAPATSAPTDTAVAAVVDNSECQSCHEDVVPTGMHAKASCVSCHKGNEEYPHAENATKAACASCHKENGKGYTHGVHGKAALAGKAAPECSTCHGVAHSVADPKTFEFRKATPELCATCHSDVGEHFNRSVHGQALANGVAEAPMCTSCHGEHDILKASDPASMVNSRNIRETCGQCHGNVRLSKRLGLPDDRLTSFDASFHGLAGKGGAQTVANCASCHGVHDILPSSNPASMTHQENLPKTCGSCHPGAGERFAIGAVHLVEGKVEPVEVSWVRLFYLILIPLTLGLMFVHNAGDWIRKLVRLRSGQPRPVIPAKPSQRNHRMYPLERLQHAGLAISFIVLSWSGFALEFPNSWWALPLTGFEGVEIRRNIHRVAAVVFIVVSIAHVLAIALSPKLRNHWKHMLPKWRDLSDASGRFLYNIGLRKTAPELPSHSYVEKAEYWAVVWGGVLMSVTGLLLWANNLALQYLPKSWLDIAMAVHWYEAVLAAAAIVIWHFYGVIFDPDVYPLDTAFLTGYSVRPHGVDAEASTEIVGADEPAQSPQPDGKPDEAVAGA